jgi:aminopeptidase-like protein
LGWKIPKEFKLNEVWVADSSGKRIIDSQNHSYHALLYGQPFHGELDRDDLLKHIETHTLPDAIPLRQAYFREKWGLCASQRQVATLAPGRYTVHIDTELYDGHLRIGEAYLPGETETEILINTYLCHPHGANDNLSSVVVAVELFRMLSKLRKRRFSYRLALWPESIGPITYISAYPERIKKTIGGHSLMMCGDAMPIGFTGTFLGDTLFDRAAQHALRINGLPAAPMKYSRWTGGSDAMHFDCVGMRLPFVTWSRGGPILDRYPAYHSSADDLTLVRPQFLADTLKVIWDALKIVERAAVYRGKYVVDPFLSKYGLYPFQHGAGGGKHGNQIARAYFELMGSVDGTLDLLQIAEKYEMSIFSFDEPVQALLGAGLIERIEQNNDTGSRRKRQC